MIERDIPVGSSAIHRWRESSYLGKISFSLLILSLVGLGLYLILAFDADYARKYWPRMLDGLGVTFILVGFSIPLGALMAIPLVLGQASKIAIIRHITHFYIGFMRSGPLLAQLYLFYFGVGAYYRWLQDVHLNWIFDEALYVGLLVFILHTSVYQAVIFTGAIKNVDQGLIEAGRALGLSKYIVFWKITWPQAMITALRPYGNEIILMVKASSIVALISVFDLMGVTKRAYSQTLDLQVFFWAAIVYLAVVETIRFLWDKIESRLTRHLSH